MPDMVRDSRDIEMASDERYDKLLMEEVEWQKSSGLTKECKDVPEVQGIPIPKQKWLRWDRLLHTLFACLLLCLPLFQKRQLKEERFLPANKLALEVSNCHVSVQDADKPGVILQHWLFMGSIKERRSNGTLRLVATMQPRLSSWFRCNLAVLAPGSHTNETMKALDVTVSNSERPTAVLLAGGVVHGPIQINGKSATVVNATGTECLEEVNIGSTEQGLVSLNLHRSRASHWRLHGLSPVVVEAAEAVQLKGSFSLLRAPEIRQDAGEVHLCTELTSITSRRLEPAEPVSTFNCTAAHRIDFQKQGDANLRVDIPCQKCTVKAGSSKLQLTDSASEALEELHDFITDPTRKTSPWLVFIRISGLPNETWSLASTPAFTYFDTSWFAALSFGVLAPKTIHRFLTLEGDLFAKGEVLNGKGMKSLVAADDLDEDCPSWKRSVNIAELLLDKLRLQNVDLFAKGVSDCRSGLVFQSSKTGLSLDWNSDGYPFVIQIAILMNVCCACALSLVVVTTAKQLILPFLYKRLSQRQIATHASQRLQIGAMEETDINVHFAHYPARGFHLTWLKPKQSQGASSYLIRFKSNAGNETSLRVKASDTEAHARTVSFFLNLDQAGLSYAKDIYSFSVITLIRSQEAGRTGWSSPVRIEGHWTTAQLPFQVLSAFLPKQNGKVSLSTFLSNACTSCTPPALTLVVENLHVICDREMVEDDFRLELFLGEREKSRKASQEKREQSFLRTSPVSIEEWLDSKPRGEGKGWTMEESGQYDGFGVDIREPISLTPPFRDAMRSGSTLHIHMVEKDSDETLGICSIDWVDLLDAYESKRTSIEFTVQEDLVDASGETVAELCFRPNFKSDMLDAWGKKPLDRGAPKHVHFTEDVPGNVFQQGMDRFLVWESANTKASQVDLYLEQAHTSTWELMVGDVRFSSETFPWVVDADFSNAPHACCRVLMVEHSEEKLHTPSWANADASRRVLCTSNWFFVVQTLTLRHLERAYAAFCRMNNIHMEGVSASVLEAQGVQVRQVHVRGCLGLRRPFSFELAPENLIKCSEGLLLTSISHTILGQSDERYRLRSHRVFLLEGLHLREGKGHWCENQMISEGFDGSVRLQEMIGSPFLAPMIDFTFHVLMTAYQILCFFAFSAMGAAFLELLQSYHAESASHDVLQVSKLEANAKSLGHLPMSALDFITFHVLASLLCILIANVMQDTPGIIPHLADHVLQLVSTCTVGVSTFCLCVMLLFFLIGALLNPSSALKPLLIVGSCGAVVATMWMQFSNLTRGLLKVIEFQVDTVFDSILESMAERVKYEVVDATYDETDLDFACTKADNRFQGLDAEGQPMKPSKDPLFSCVKPDQETISTVKENMAKGMMQRSERQTAEANDLDLDITPDHLQRLTNLYQHYILKTSLDDALEWRIYEETDALTDIMLREHNMRLQLLDFNGIAAADPPVESVPAKGPAKAVPASGKSSQVQRSMPKAYLTYKAIYRENFDQIAGMIVKGADQLFQWSPIVEKVTNFFDDSVPKYICSCAMSSFDGNRKDSMSQQVLAKVAQHVEDIMKIDPARTVNLNDLISEMMKRPDDADGWASGLLYSETQDIHEPKQVLSFVREQVKQALPNQRTTSAIPVYKLVAVFESLLKGRVWWHALIPFLKEEGCGFLDAEIDKKILARGFKHTSKGAGFMDYQDIPDVLMWMTEGGLWKSAAVSLLREIEVGGELGNMNLGTEEDEQSRVHDEWNPPTWPKWILERWQEATDEEENPKEGKACFLQKSDVPGFIQDLILATEKGLRNTEEGLEQVPGYPGWKYKPMDGMQGCPAEIWRYVDELNLAQLRGISWEGFDYLLEEFDLDMPQPASRKIFSGVEGGVEKGFVQAPHIMRTIEQIQTKYRPISLSGFTKLLKQSGITLPRRVIESLFNELDDITLKIGATEEFICQDLVNLNDLGPLVEKYLSGGMWLEAVYGVLQNEEIEASFADVSRIFAIMDKEDSGILKPSGVIKLMMSLQRTGLSYDTFSDMILKDMRFVVNDSELRILFNMVDRSGNGSISKMEFIQGFHTLMRHLVPNMILNSLSVLPEQIVRHILKALVFLLLLFAFLFVSMDALTPSSADLDYMGGVQAGIAGIAAVGVRFQSTSGMDTTSIKEAIAAHLSELLPGARPKSNQK